MGYPGGPMTQPQQVQSGPPPNQGFYQGAGPQMGPGGPFPSQMIRPVPGMGTPIHHSGMGLSPGMIPQHLQQYTSHMTNQPTPIVNVGPNNMRMGQTMPMEMGHPRQMPMVQRPIMYHPMGGMVATGPQPIVGIESHQNILPNLLRQQEVPVISSPPGTASPLTDDYRYPAVHSAPANMVFISLPFFLSILPLLPLLVILAL